MENKDTKEIHLSGDDAIYLRDLFGMQTDYASMSKTLDTLFGMALFGESRNGGGDGVSSNKTFRDYSFHYSMICDMKKVFEILSNAVDR